MQDLADDPGRSATEGELRGIPARVLAAAVIGALGGMQSLLLVFLGHPTLAIALFAAAAVFGVLAFRFGLPEDGRSPTVGWRCLLVCVGLSALIYILGGEGRLVYANTDWQVRNAVLLDLVRYPWPFFYSLGDRAEILRAPLGMYLLPALAGKLIDFRIAEFALLVQNSAMLGTLFALGSTLYRSARERWIALAVFLGFSGMDIVGQAMAHKSIWLHLEQWAGMQFSSHVTQAFWVPQHALAGWIFAVFYLLARDRIIPAWIALAVVPLSALLSPLAMIGTLPFAAHLGLEKLWRRQLGWKDILLPGIAALMSVPALLYMTAGSDSVGSRPLTLPISHYAIFIAFELGVYLFALWFVRERLRFGKITAAIVVTVLLAVPFVQVGQAVDFVMRASITSLAILSLMVADIFIRPQPESGNWLIARRWAAIGLLIGLATPIGEIGRAVFWQRAPVQLCGYFGVVPRGFATYVAPLDRIPRAIRPNAPSAIVPHEPKPCWSHPWRDAATGKLQ